MWKTLTEDALTSKKFQVWLATVVVAIGNAALKKFAPGVALDETTVAELIAAGSAYIVGQGIADHGKPAAEQQVQLGAAQAMSSGPEKDAALKALAAPAVAPKASS